MADGLVRYGTVLYRIVVDCKTRVCGVDVVMRAGWVFFLTRLHYHMPFLHSNWTIQYSTAFLWVLSNQTCEMMSSPTRQRPINGVFSSLTSVSGCVLLLDWPSVPGKCFILTLSNFVCFGLPAGLDGRGVAALSAVPRDKPAERTRWRRSCCEKAWP